MDLNSVFCVLLVLVNTFWTPANGNLDKPSVQEVLEWSRATSPVSFRRFHAERMKNMMDWRYNPCQDFYEFACGNWESIHSDAPGIPVQTHELLFHKQEYFEKWFQKPDVRGVYVPIYESKMKEYYNSCVADKRMASMKSFVNNFASWPAFEGQYWSEHSFDWLNVTAKLTQYNVHVFFKYDVDNGREKIMTDFIMGSILDFALGQVDNTTYETFVTSVLGQFDVDPTYAQGMISRTLPFLQKIKGVPIDFTAEIRPLYEWQRLLPGYDFRNFLGTIRGRYVRLQETMGVQEVEYMRKLHEVLSKTDARTIADFIYITMAVTFTIDWNNDCVSIVEQDMENAMGAVYVQKYFGDDLKGNISEIVENLRNSGIALMKQTSWIDERTKTEALRKLNAIETVIGYRSKDVSETYLNNYYNEFVPVSSFFANKMALLSLKFKEKQKMLGKDVIEAPFSLIAPNAFYNPGAHGALIVVPVLTQPPLYHTYMPKFIQYGLLGFVVGHEFMHGFDIFNFRYGAGGQHWMTSSLELSYQFRVECFYSQFNRFRDQRVNKTVNAALTMAENLADAEAAKIAYNAYKEWARKHPQEAEAELTDYYPVQLTQEQIFFVSMAQFHCDSRDDAQLKTQIETDTHAPGKYRALGIVANSRDFANAFNCPKDSEMNPTEKCSYFLD